MRLLGHPRNCISPRPAPTSNVIQCIPKCILLVAERPATSSYFVPRVASACSCASTTRLHKMTRKTSAAWMGGVDRCLSVRLTSWQQCAGDHRVIHYPARTCPAGKYKRRRNSLLCWCWCEVCGLNLFIFRPFCTVSPRRDRSNSSCVKKREQTTLTSTPSRAT